MRTSSLSLRRQAYQALHDITGQVFALFVITVAVAMLVSSLPPPQAPTRRVGT